MESDSHSAIYTIYYMLCTVNAIVNYTPMVLICVETKWPGDWFERAVLGCRSLVLVIIIIIILYNQVLRKIKNAVKNDVKNGRI